MITEHKKNKKEQECTKDKDKIKSKNKHMKEHFSNPKKGNDELKAVLEVLEVRRNMKKIKQKVEHVDTQNEKPKREKRRNILIMNGLKMDTTDGRELILMIYRSVWK